MSSRPAVRWAAAVGSLVIAIGLAVWSGVKSRPPRRPAPSNVPIGRQTPDDGSAVCAARLAKLGKALRMYADDNDGAFPITPTAGDSEADLLPLLKGHKVTAKDFHCPTSEGPGGQPYVYHSYRERGPGDWPNWMLPKHAVRRDSPPDTWLMADRIAREAPGPHSATEKAFNVLRADGSVKMHVGRPRAVYR